MSRQELDATEAERFSDLSEAERRHAILKGVLFIALAWVLIFSAYFCAPERIQQGVSPVLRFVIGLAVLAVVIVWQGRRIVKGKVPELRAVEALGTIIPLFLVVFASIYLTTSKASPHSFTEHLDHVSSLYFTITVFSTVGFGDITPTTDAMRLVVSIQMLIDLILLGALVRMIFNRAKHALDDDSSSPPSSSTGEATHA